MSFLAKMLVFTLFASLGLVWVNEAQAIPIRVDFTGAITNFTGARLGSPGIEIDAPFERGDEFTGHFIYESDTPASYYGATTSGHYGAVTEFYVAFSTPAGTAEEVFFNPLLITNPARQRTLVTVGNASNPRFSASAYNGNQGVLAGQAFDGSAPIINFAASDANALSGYDLATININTIADQPFTVGELPVATTAADLTNGRGDPFSLIYWNTWFNPAEGRIRYGSHIVAGRLSSLSIATTAVPEPSSVILLLLSLGMVIRRRVVRRCY